MAFVIPDETLKQAGISEQEARIELACRLFDIGRMSLFHARELARLASRSLMEDELVKRGIALARPTPQDLLQDLENLNMILGPATPERS